MTQLLSVDERRYGSAMTDVSETVEAWKGGVKDLYEAVS